MKPILFINPSAGTAAQTSGGALKEKLETAFSEEGCPVETRLLPGQGLDRVFREARREQRPLIVAGGDGTVAAAIQVLAGTGIALGVIPLGTLNLLANDLGMARDPVEAARQIAGAQEIDIDIGLMTPRDGGTIYFHSIAGLGFFTQVALERAQIRAKSPRTKILNAGFAMMKALFQRGDLHVTMEEKGHIQEFRTPALLVTNNLFDGTWRRPQLNERTFEINIARAELPMILLRSGMTALTGSWRESQDIITLHSPDFKLDTKRKRMVLSLDGEILRTRGPLRFELRAKGLRCLASRA